MIEIIIHGRGGQGTVVAAEILANAALKDRKFALFRPKFAAERRGAPVKAFVRISDLNFCWRHEIKKADGIIILDGLLLNLVNFVNDFKENAWLVINTNNPEKNHALATQKAVSARINLSNIWTADASLISSRCGLDPKIVNSAILGVLASPSFNIVSLISLKEALKEITPRKIEENINALTEAFEIAGGQG